MQFITVGSDKRQLCLSRLLSQTALVSAFGSPSCPVRTDALVLPCPSFDCGGQLRADCTLSDLVPFLTEGVTVFCCGSTAPLAPYPVHAVDLLKDEIAVLENARLTAEAAILAAMEHCGDSLHKKRCLVIGYGRIGTYLARLLAAVGARCTVYARRAQSRTLAEGFGLSITDGGAFSQNFDFVFNTVPAQALTRTALSSLPQRCVWVELASAPGGLPQGGAPLPFTVLPAGGLPGKYLPCAAARVLYAAILRHISIIVNDE